MPYAGTSNSPLRACTMMVETTRPTQPNPPQQSTGQAQQQPGATQWHAQAYLTHMQAQCKHRVRAHMRTCTHARTHTLTHTYLGHGHGRHNLLQGPLAHCLFLCTLRLDGHCLLAWVGRRDGVAACTCVHMHASQGLQCHAHKLGGHSPRRLITCVCQHACKSSLLEAGRKQVVRIHDLFTCGE